MSSESHYSRSATRRRPKLPTHECLACAAIAQNPRPPKRGLGSRPHHAVRPRRAAGLADRRRTGHGAGDDRRPAWCWCCIKACKRSGRCRSCNSRLPTIPRASPTRCWAKSRARETYQTRTALSGRAERTNRRSCTPKPQAEMAAQRWPTAAATDLDRPHRRTRFAGSQRSLGERFRDSIENTARMGNRGRTAGRRPLVRHAEANFWSTAKRWPVTPQEVWDKFNKFHGEADRRAGSKTVSLQGKDARAIDRATSMPRLDVDQLVGARPI